MTDKRKEPQPGEWGVRLEGTFPALGLDFQPPAESYAEHDPWTVWHLVNADTERRDWIDLGRGANEWCGVSGRFAAWILRDDYVLPMWEHLLEIDTHSQRWRQIAIRYFGRVKPGVWDALAQMTNDEEWAAIADTLPPFRETLLHVTDILLAKYPVPPIATPNRRLMS
jgi:hypothetical protein